jgi:hypothetical protein
LDAIEKAADLAHVANYEIVDLTGLTIFGNGTFMLTTDRQPVDASMQSDAWLAVLQQAEADPWPDFYHIYIPPTD